MSWAACTHGAAFTKPENLKAKWAQAWQPHKCVGCMCPECQSQAHSTEPHQRQHPNPHPTTSLTAYSIQTFRCSETAVAYPIKEIDTFWNRSKHGVSQHSRRTLVENFIDVLHANCTQRRTRSCFALHAVCLQGGVSRSLPRCKDKAVAGHSRRSGSHAHKKCSRT